MNNTAQPVIPKPAATIILLRDGNSGLEVLILRKASGKHFASGALVFPGGKVDAADTAFAGDIGEPEFAAIMTIGEPLMVQAQRVENGGVEVVHADRIGCAAPTDFIKFAV